MSALRLTGVAERLATLLGRARAQARTTGRGVLVSVVERAPAVDPLDALEALPAGQAAADRMFWARARDGFALAGVGAVATFAPTGAERFATIDRAWRALLSEALVDDQSEGAPGAGPLLMGGFAFEPDGPRTARWRDFPSALLRLPRLQLAAVGDARWLTATLLVGADGEPDMDVAALARLAERFTAARPRAAAPERAGSWTEALVRSDVRPAAEWRALVRRATDAIRAGAFEKVVLAREVRATAPRPLDAGATLRHLRAAHPTAYVFGVWHGESVFLGATPERLVKLERGVVTTSSLAGSARRGATPAEDAELTARLMASGKDRVEHEVVRRMLCAALGEICDDVTAAAEPSLLSLPNVHHLHTEVRGRLRAERSVLDLVARLHPTPAVGGAPRASALRFIREHEGMDRGWYAAPVGWLQRDRGEFAVALRSALLGGASASLFAGCGIVADSDPEREYAESLVKLVAMERALAAALATTAADETPFAAAGGAGAR